MLLLFISSVFATEVVLTNSLPIMNQKDTPFCYSFAATKIIDSVKLAENTLKVLSSPVGLAKLYSKTTATPIDSGGHICKAMDILTSYGGCITKDEKTCPSPKLNVSCYELLRYNRSYKNGESLLDLAEFKLIEHEKSKIPLAMKLCSDFLSKGSDYKGYSNINNDCTVHYALIVGVKKEGLVRSFLIEDFQGSNCNGLSKAFKCENGKFWIKESIIIHNLLGIVYVK